MKKSIIKISLLIFLLGCVSFFVVMNYQDRQMELDVVKLKDDFESSDNFVFMMENLGGDFVKNQEQIEWPSSENYEYDFEHSGCIDTDGKKLEGVLTFKNGVAKVDTNKTTYCYLYFKIKRDNLSEICYGNSLSNCVKNNSSLLSNVANISTTLKGDMYRYQGYEENGSVINNYVCFGTSSVDNCVNNPDKYLYRIVGINKDGNMQILKNTSIGNFKWNATNVSTTLSNSSIFNLLNDTGSTTNFLKNTNYIPTNDNGVNWQDKIINWNWTNQTFPMYDSDGIKYHAANATKMYDKYITLTDTISGKIGLMYLHDHYYATGTNEAGVEICETGAKKCNNLSTRPTYWIKYNVTQQGASNYEWLYSYYGKSENNYYAYCMAHNGIVAVDQYINANAVRPAFYLINTTKIIDGTGTQTNPYVIN